MPPSYRKIDYSLRAAKHTERRMLLEFFRRLSAFEPLEEYAYSGMGSLWFADFVLVHRQLGIRHMTSMEWPRGNSERINDNLPLGSIKMIPKATTQAIPDLDWSRRQILWLDYDGIISRSILTDVTAAIQRARSGSMLVISLQCNEALEIQVAEQNGGADALTLFKDTFGRERAGDIEYEDLLGWSFAETSRRLLLQEIEAAISRRNEDASASSGELFKYNTACCFEYADDAKMTSIALSIYSENEQHLFDKCYFSGIDFIQDGDQIIRIEMPNLTPHEMGWLRRQLPLAASQQLEIRYLPPADATKYARLYRYFPNFGVLEH